MHPLIGSVLLLVPRHPQRFDEVAALLSRRSLGYVRRSENRPLPSGCRIVLGDTMGEMPAYYGVADCAFVGGSLLPFGGQNMIEAAALGVPALFGPHTFNFSDAAEQAVTAGAAIRVADAESLFWEVALLMRDPARRRSMGQSGREWCETHRGATARTMAVADRLLGPRHAPPGDATDRQYRA
jgi:3-deoxy-D-manno-octulosonic-acid transferase